MKAPAGISIDGLRGRLQRNGIDHRLADGADPGSDAVIRARAEELTREETRRSIAENLERTLARAAGPRPLLSSQVPLARHAIHDSRPDLETIVERLKAPDDIPPQAVARVQLLLTDGAGPLYGEHRGGDLKAATHNVLDAIEHGKRARYASR